MTVSLERFGDEWMATIEHLRIVEYGDTISSVLAGLFEWIRIDAKFYLSKPDYKLSFRARELKKKYQALLSEHT